MNYKLKHSIRDAQLIKIKCLINYIYKKWHSKYEKKIVVITTFVLNTFNSDGMPNSHYLFSHSFLYLIYKYYK